MNIKPIDVEKIKVRSDKDKAEAIAEYEEEKKVLIEEYMRVQEIVDEYNEHIYNLTCRIEQINKAVKEMR